MRKLFVLLLLTSSKLIVGQTLDSVQLSNYDQNIRNYSPSYDYQNWMDEKRLLPEGIYYQYVGRIVYEDGEKIFQHYPVRNPERFFGFLLAFGVSLKEAWYRQQESNCRGFDVRVSSSLLIRVEQNLSDEFMERLGFTITNYPSVGDCPYNVLHYIFSQKIEP